MTEHTHEPQPAPKTERSYRWVGPSLLAALIVVPILIFVFSNIDPIPISWAAFSWEAPGWIVLLAVFVAGLLVSPILAWGWRRRRKKRHQAVDTR